MGKRFSRSFAAAELVLIVLPVLLMAFSSWLLIDLFGQLVESPAQRFVLVGLILISPALCACAGILTGLLAMEGPDALGRASTSALLLELLGRFFQIEQLKALDSHFGVFSLGAPMLIPVVHVMISRQRHRSDNKTMEPTR